MSNDTTEVGSYNLSDINSRVEKIPQLLHRNSVITGYKFMSNDTTGVGSYNLSDISSRVENTTASTQKQ